MANQPSNLDLRNISIRSYNAIYKDENIGFFKEDSVEINVSGNTKKIGVDQIFSEVARAQIRGEKASVKLIMMRNNPSHVAGLILENTFGFIPKGSDFFYGLGDPDIDCLELCGELLLVPKSNDTGDMTNSWTFWNAYANIESGVKFVGSKNNFQEFEVTFEFLPDLDQDSQYMYGIWGNNFVGDVSEGFNFLWFQSNPRYTGGPVRSLPAITIKRGTRERIQVFGIRLGTQIQSTLLNGALSSTAETVTVDSTKGFRVGDVCEVGTELVYIKAITSSTVLSIARGQYGSTAAAQSDNASFISYDRIIQRLTNDNFVDFAAATPANVDIGNVAYGTDTTWKGCLFTGAGNGTSNITATHAQAGTTPILIATSTA